MAPKINAIADHGDDVGGEGVGQLAETKREVKNIQAESLFFSILELLQWNIHTEIYGSQILFWQKLFFPQQTVLENCHMREESNLQQIK